MACALRSQIRANARSYISVSLASSPTSIQRAHPTRVRRNPSLATANNELGRARLHPTIATRGHRDDRCSGEAMTNSKHPQERKKLLILGLHGYLQNGESFRARIGSVRKALKSRADFAFIDAPYDASVEALGGAAKASQAGSQDGYSTDPERILRETEGTAVGSRSWWTWDEQVERPSKAKTYFGMADSLKAIAEFLQSERPDGVLAFSQGASATALLLSVLSPSPGSERVQADRLAELGLTTDAGVGDIPLPKFVVLVGPFLPNDASWAQVIRERRPSGVDVLMVAGEKDELVPPSKTLALSECFDPDFCEVWQHPGGHMVPTGTGEFKKKLVEFIDGAVARDADRALAAVL